MLKKYFILAFLFTSFVFLNNKASAFILYTDPSVDPCSQRTLNATATNVISEYDLKGTIPVCIVSSAFPPFNILIANTQTGFSTTTTVSPFTGTSTIQAPYIFNISSIQNTDTISLRISDSNTGVDNAQITAYVPIVPITLSNTQNLADNGVLPAGNSITFSCSNATELYYDPILNATNVPVTSDYDGGTSYNLVYSINNPTPGTHTIECDNIGGSLTREVFHFVATGNKLNIDNTTYSPTQALATVHFTWSSNGTDCALYNYDKSIKFGNATGNSSSGFAFNLTSPNLPQGANTYGYNIKCYDSGNPSTMIEDTNSNLSSTTEMISGVSTTVAWYNLSATFSCPNGSTPDPGNNNSCVEMQGPPICNFTDNTDNFVSCSCQVGTITSLEVKSTNGSSQSIVPPTTPFAWDNLHYRYDTSCGNLPALLRPYTHFLAFNVSAGFIKPGGAIDINWMVQDPTSTCKIVGVDIKTGQEIFNSEGTGNALIKASVTTPKSSSATSNFTDGSFKSLMNKTLIINSSARFTASCENEGPYMPGHYQLARDVYTTNSQER